VNVWGVGTKLVTAYDQPALGGVYKLTAIRGGADHPWQYKLKLSEQVAKISTPGILQVRRFARDGLFIADAIYNEPFGVADPATIIDPGDLHRTKIVPGDANWEDLLVEIYRGGRRVYNAPSLDAIRSRVQSQLAQLHPSIRRFANPHEYPAGLESQLSDLRSRLIQQARQSIGRTGI
jgi:nicotinate phosphoribosyltransferase